jgi:PAS domain S-box-containing protein
MIFQGASALNQALDPFVACTGDYRILFINPAAARLARKSADELTGQHIDSFLEVLEGLDAPEAAFHLVAETGAPLVRECKDSAGECWFELTVTRYEPNGLSIWLHDITARKKTEISLRDDENLYRSIFAALHEGIVFLDPGVEIFACNRRAEEILGLTRDEIVGRASVDPRWRAIHEDGSPFPGEEHPSSVTLATGKAMSDVMMGVHRPDGTQAWININSEPVVRSGENRPFAAVVSFADVTDRKLAEHALKKSEQRFRKVFEDSPLGVALLRSDWTFIRANAALHKMLDYEDGELEHIRYSVLISSKDRDSAALVLEDVFAKRTPEVHREIEGVTKGGKVVRLSLCASLMGDEDESDPVALLMLQDVTARFDLEMQLRQVQRLESVGRLAGGVAHDFNNLLTVINGYAEMIMAKAPEGSDVRNNAKQIRNAGEQAAGLTKKLLRLGRKYTAQSEALDLNSVVEENLEMLSHVMGPNVSLNKELNTDLPVVKGNRSELHLVLMNLAMNALDAMPEGGPLTVRTFEMKGANRPHGQSGKYVAMEVQDSGIGMDAETQKLIFDPFFTTKRLDKGTGLGLAIVYGIVQQHSGWIHLESAPGQGARFTVYLPATDEAIQPAAPLAPAALGGNETVLVADDQTNVLDLVGEILDNYGYRVLKATGGEEALRVSREFDGKIDLLLTDVVMPGMDGVVLAESIAAERKGIRTLFMSAYSDNLLAKRKALESGPRLISKPLEARMLASAVRGELDKEVAEWAVEVGQAVWPVDFVHADTALE